MKLYKLTTEDGYTRKGCDNQCLWGENVTHSGTGKGRLCGPGYIHAYTDPKLAVALNPIHANITNPLLWVCEGDIILTDCGLKVGCKSLTTLYTIKPPVLTPKQLAAFAVLCTRAIDTNSSYEHWSDNWLQSVDTTIYRSYDVDGIKDEYTSRAVRAAGYAATSCFELTTRYAAIAVNYAAQAANIDLIQLINKAADEY
jgi:hypothetical protein